MDARRRSALGLGGIAFGWLALGLADAIEMLIFAVLWAGLAIAWWFDEETFTIPIEDWRANGRRWRHLPMALLICGIAWAIIGTGIAIAIALV